MATKTISIDLDAYDRLAKARLTPTESFSRVIKRGRWDSSDKTAGALLREASTAPYMTDAELKALDEAQRRDPPPEDPWQKH